LNTDPNQKLTLPERIAALAAIAEQLTEAVRQLQAENPVPDAPDELITIKEASGLAGVSTRTIETALANGELERFRPGGRSVMLWRNEVVAWKNARWPASETSEPASDRRD
jgi:excisionase family DNA binding protein